MPALDGLRILDMTQYEAGTSCTQALAWFGADVVKIERPETGDPGRGVAWGDGDSLYFLNWNSNKRSVTINLGAPEGRQILLDMLPNYDVFIENYGPGVIEKLGLTYDVMRAVPPGIIYARIKGFGSSGPYADYKCYDMIAQAAAGTLSVTGFPDGPPTLPGTTIGDSGTGSQMAIAILAAYIQRQRTGEGQVIEISMQEAVTYYMRTTIAAASQWNTIPVPRRGNRLGAPTDLYPCTPFGPNDYVFLMVVTSRMWDTLCAAVGMPELINDPRFADGETRRTHADALWEIFAGWTRQRTKFEAMHELASAGVPVSAVLDTQDLFRDPHLNERGFVTTVHHKRHGDVQMMGWAPRMSASQVEITAAPLLGEHTDEVLREDLDCDAEQLQALRDLGIIA